MRCVYKIFWGRPVRVIVLDLRRPSDGLFSYLERPLYTLQLFWEEGLQGQLSNT